jgi:hypothetical protein
MELEDYQKAEMTFVPDAYKTSHHITGLLALAKRLQTLIIMEPGTIPNLTGAGVGIATYLGELADDTTLTDIRNDIFTQVYKYLPNNVISDISVKILESKDDGKKFLAFFVKLGTVVDDKTSFALTFGQNISSGSVISDFYF